ncbi:MAG: hypothetical protein Q7S95_03535 [bacterium]|nr:hypothetical protein [bacterium]
MDAGTPDYTALTPYSDLIIDTINNVFVPVLFAIAFIIFLYGVARAYVFSQGEPAEVAKGHKLILWGLIAFVVMLSVWGLVNILSETLDLSNTTIPTYPEI